MADTAGATEVERLLVRLVGDGSSYQKMMVQAQESSKVAAAQIEQATKRIEGFQRGIQGFAQATLGVLGTLGVAGGLWASFEKFSKFEEGQIRLKAAITVSGQAMDETLKKFGDYADVVTKNTMVTKGDTLALLQQATTRGLDAEQAQKAATVSIALAGATGQEAGSMMHASIALMQGNTHLAKRMLGLHGVKDETEVVTKITKMMASGLAQQKAISETTQSSLERLQRSLKLMNTEVGRMVDESLKPVVKWLQEAVDWFKNLGPEVKKNTVYFIAALGAIVGLAPALAGLKFFLGPIGSLFSMVGSAIAFMVSPIGLVVAGVTSLTVAFLFFSESGGEAIKWFTDRWDDLQKEVGPGIEGIKNAIKAGDIPLAFEIAWAQIQLTFAKGIRPLQEFWELFVYKMKLVWANTMANISEVWNVLVLRVTAGYTVAMVNLGKMSAEQQEQILNDAIQNLYKAREEMAKLRDQRIRDAGVAGVANMEAIEKNIRDLEAKRDQGVQAAAAAAARIAMPVPDKRQLELPDIMDKKLGDAAKSAEKLQSSLRGSTSALQAISDYADVLSGVKQGKGGKGHTGAGAGIAGGVEAGRDELWDEAHAKPNERQRVAAINRANDKWERDQRNAQAGRMADMRADNPVMMQAQPVGGGLGQGMPLLTDLQKRQLDALNKIAERLGGQKIDLQAANLE